MEIIEWVVTIVMFGSYIPYVIQIANDDVSPPKSTWIVWCVLDWLVVANMATKGVMNGALIAATFGATAIVIALMFKKSNEWSLLEKTCSALGFLGALLWLVFDPELGLLFFLLAIGASSFPTLQQAWEFPEKEKKALKSWLVRTIACIVSLINVMTFQEEWSFELLAQPILFAGIRIAVVILLLRKKKTNL